MPRNGSGTFSLSSTLAPPGTQSNSTTINAIMDDIADALTDSVNVDGTKAWAVNQPMGSHKFTGMAVGSARTDSVALSQVQDGLLYWADGGGTADAITATYAPALTSLSDGQQCFVRATAANATTTPTFAPNGLTARTIKKTGAVALAIGDIVGNDHELHLRYNSTGTPYWELLNPGGVSLGGSNTFTAAQSITVNNAVTAAVTTLFTTTHTSTGTVAAGFGGRWTMNLENDDGSTIKECGSIDYEWVDATDGSEDGAVAVRTMIDGTLAQRFVFGYGLYATGWTDKGNDSINAGQLYSGNNPVAARVYKTSDETIQSDAGLTADSELRFTPEANAKYAFKVVVHFTSNSTADFKFGMNGPAAPTKFSAYVRYIDPAAIAGFAQSNEVQGIWTAYETTGVSVVWGSNSEGGCIVIEGIIQNASTSSALSFTWSQNTSAAFNTTVHAGSYLEFCKIA